MARSELSVEETWGSRSVLLWTSFIRSSYLKKICQSARKMCGLQSAPLENEGISRAAQKQKPEILRTMKTLSLGWGNGSRF